MRKATLNARVIPKNKAKFTIQNLSNGALQVTTRGEVSQESDTIERKDKTVVPSGRINPGEFDITIPLSERTDVDTMTTWRQMCLDADTNTGGSVSATGLHTKYKRDCVLQYFHIFDDGTAEEYIFLSGCFVKNAQYPDYDMDGSEEAEVTFTISYDTMQRQTNHQGSDPGKGPSAQS